ncbi:geranylgeranyl transferase beta subunit [Fonsecaea pedrosoi]|nr:geranylgeranyl transferase beta subunit [Fonsecaea pedrosoi]
MAPEEPYVLDKERHVKYWKRCAQILPEPYTSGEAHRMSFGFFIVAALDLLGVLDTAITPSEKHGWIEWIYTCQVPHTGGFRGFTGTLLGGQRSYHNWHWDPANLPNTYFALAALVVLGDDLSRVKRKECLAWVAALQRPNGSFGEFLGENDQIEGEDDPRLCMCAMGVMKILQGHGEHTKPSSFNEANLRRYIASCQSHEGGIGQAPLLEAHSGLNYCGIATLSFLALLQNPSVSMQEMAERANFDITVCTRWMLDRQTTWVEEEEEDDEEEDEDTDNQSRQRVDTNNNNEDQQSSPPNMSGLHTGLVTEKAIAGFCGRCGKIADTCYCFWNVGALAQILQQHHLVDVNSLRRYLLGKVTHVIGGFAKGPGELPDLLHSYLGLATLAIYNEPGLKELDPTFCISKDAVQRLAKVAQQQKVALLYDFDPRTRDS